MKKILLRGVRKESKKLRYEFPEYAVNSKVCVKKSKSSECVPIHNTQYLVNIT